MKRFYWIEVCMLFASYIMLINRMEVLSIVISILNLMIILLFAREVNFMRFCFMTVSVMVFSMMLSENGGLYALYKYLDIILILTSVHLALLYEILSSEHSFSVAFKPYCFMLMMSLLFFSTGIVMSDCSIFDIAYPYGIMSLFALIGIIFVPYLMTVTLSFVSHEYKY